MSGLRGRAQLRAPWLPPLLAPSFTCGLGLALALALEACRVGHGSTADALPYDRDGGGLAERFLTETVPSADRSAASTGDGAASSSDAHGFDAVADGTPAGGELDARAACQVGDAGACARGEACYPLPLGGAPTGSVACAIEGLGSDLGFCLVQNDCDRDHYCDGAGDVGGLCRRRCDPRAPTACTRDTQCWAFPRWLTAGVCR